MAVRDCSNHAYNIQYVFGYPLYAGPRSTGNYTEEERRLARGMVTMWTNFAKSGDPNVPEDASQFTNATWAEYDLDFQSFRQFTNQGALMGSQFQERRMQLWSDLLPPSKGFHGQFSFLLAYIGFNEFICLYKMIDTTR